MRKLMLILLFILPFSVAFSQNKNNKNKDKCTVELHDDYAFVEGQEIIDIPVFQNDIGNFNMANARILTVPGCGPHHGEVWDPDIDCFTYTMNHRYCSGMEPSEDHFFNYLDTFEYYVTLVCEDYCGPDDGKIWTITSEYLGDKYVEMVEVVTKKGIPVGNVTGLNKGDFFTIDGTHLPVNQTDWDYTFTFDDGSKETVRIHTSCSQLIFYVDFGLLMPVSGCIATFKEKEAGVCDPPPFTRNEIKTRAGYYYPELISDTAMVIIETAVLPLYILDFQLRTNKNENRITWSLTNVSNEQYVALEKSYDGIDYFELQRYDEIFNGSYQFIDRFSDRNIEMHYYRLAIMGYNGEISYSNVIMGRTITDYISPVLVYPNPTTGMVTLELLDEDVRMRSLFMDDIAGRRMMYIPLDNNKSITMSLKDRVGIEGIYFVGIELSNGEVVHKRILLTQ